MKNQWKKTPEMKRLERTLYLNKLTLKELKSNWSSIIIPLCTMGIGIIAKTTELDWLGNWIYSNGLGCYLIGTGNFLYELKSKKYE